MTAKRMVLADGEVRHGDPSAPADVRMLVGYCVFDSHFLTRTPRQLCERQ